MLASRLGVAALVVIVLSFFTSNRPFERVHVVKADVTHVEEDGRTKLTIGPITIDPADFEDAETHNAIREGLNALRSAEIIDETHIVALEARIQQERLALESTARALEADSLVIARDLSAREVERSDENRPDRLSEAEIQNLVVERLLSVQNQMREDDASGANSADLASAPSASSPEVDIFLETDPPEPATPAPALPAMPRQTLERVDGDFSGQTLMGTDFRNKDLSGLNFSNARLTAAKFDGSDLTGANFSGAKIQGASFAGTIMDDIVLVNAQAQTAHFENASLLRANLGNANFAGAVLTGADLRGANTEGLNLNGADMQGTRTGEAP